MTQNSAEKRAARGYALAHDVPYRVALGIIREQRAAVGSSERLVQRILIEAIEGCGIRHWCGVTEWDGVSRATITDLGGETFVLDAPRVTAALADFLAEHHIGDPLDVDSYLADEIVQTMLFGGVIYRSQVRRRLAA